MIKNFVVKTLKQIELAPEFETYKGDAKLRFFILTQKSATQKRLGGTLICKILFVFRLFQ